jgi:hypothetical protein
VSKGRKVPDQPIDHAANLRDRLGRAAYDAIPDDGAPPWERITESGREDWRTIGQAVMDVIVKRDRTMGQIGVSTKFAYDTQRPYVDLHVDLSPAQFTPGKAREIALLLLETADASETEATLMAFAREIGLDIAEAGKLLNQLRQYREKQRGTEASSA